MKYAWFVSFESNLGRRSAWVLAEDAREAKALVESQNAVESFTSVVRHEASKVLCYVENGV
jgi:hypothetical protein